MLAHLLGTVAASVVTGFVFTGTVLWSTVATPPYRDDLTSRYFSIMGDVRKEDTSGPFGGPCAKIGSVGLPGLIFEGDPDDLLLGANDFTIECWIAGNGSEPSADVHFMTHWSSNATYRAWTLDYAPASDTIRFRLRTEASSTTRTASFTVSSPGTFFDGTWHHIAAVRNGTVITVYVDGVAGGTTYTIGTDPIRDPNTFYRPGIGCAVEEEAFGPFVNGKITECRITRGTTGGGAARYTSGFTPPSAVFGRNSTDDALWTSVIMLIGFGGAWGHRTAGSLGLEVDDLTHPTAVNITTGMGSVTSDGLDLRLWNASQHMTLVAPSGLNPGSGDFTVEGWFFYASASTNQNFFGFRTASNLCYYFRRASGTPTQLQALLSTDASAVALTLSGNDPGAGSIHLALTREGNTFRWYINGSLVASNTLSGALADPTGDTFTLVTRDLSMTTLGFRIISGQAIYTAASFTPPSVSSLLDNPS